MLFYICETLREITRLQLNNMIPNNKITVLEIIWLFCSQPDFYEPVFGKQSGSLRQMFASFKDKK